MFPYWSPPLKLNIFTLQTKLSILFFFFLNIFQTLFKWSGRECLTQNTIFQLWSFQFCKMHKSYEILWTKHLLIPPSTFFSYFAASQCYLLMFSTTPALRLPNLNYEGTSYRGDTCITSYFCLSEPCWLADIGHVGGCLLLLLWTFFVRSSK